MKKLIWLLLGFPLVALATDIKDVVRSVGESKVTMSTTMYGMPAEVVYVGEFGTCSSVSVIWPRQRIENFRLCREELLERNTVSPSWDGEGQEAIFASVVNNAILHGEARQMDTNGYLIRARTLNALNSSCKTLETIISYDGDLVDRDLRKVCEK